MEIIWPVNVNIIILSWQEIRQKRLYTRTGLHKRQLKSQLNFKCKFLSCTFRVIWSVNQVLINLIKVCATQSRSLLTNQRETKGKCFTTCTITYENLFVATFDYNPSLTSNIHSISRCVHVIRMTNPMWRLYFHSICVM